MLDVGRWTLDVCLLQTELGQFIRHRIKADGPQPFAWFMQQALYHPEHGYYSGGRAAIGRRGDYFTNVSVGSIFGQLLATQFVKIWERLGKSKDFFLVEQGAHHGELARDVLQAAQKRSPEFFEALNYRIIEPFPRLQDRQSQTLTEFGTRVRWRLSLDELEPFNGVHFSNELLDSMPVHLIALTEDGWREKFVALNGEEFVFVARRIADSKLQACVSKLPRLPIGYETEINLAALDWIENIAKKLQCGFVLAIDYGFPRDQFYASHRTSGTLQVRAQHQRLGSPFEQISRADITAHPDWTSLAERAGQCGLRIAGFADQHHFITGIMSESPVLLENADSKTKRQLQTLLHPEMLGRGFQVLALSKDVDLSASLAGFKFGQDPRRALGL